MGEGMKQIAISEHTEDNLRAVNDWLSKTGVWLENLSGHDHPLSCIILLMLFFSLFFIELFLRIFYSAGGRCGLEKVALDRQSSQWLCSTSSCIGHGSVRERCCRACDVMMEARGEPGVLWVVLSPVELAMLAPGRKIAVIMLFD